VEAQPQASHRVSAHGDAVRLHGVPLQAGLEKKPAECFFFFFFGFFGFYGFFGFFYIFAQKRKFLGFFQFQEYF
jgi:hypothetical protein